MQTRQSGFCRAMLAWRKAGCSEVSKSQPAPCAATKKWYHHLLALGAGGSEQQCRSMEGPAVRSVTCDPELLYYVMLLCVRSAPSVTPL